MKIFLAIIFIGLNLCAAAQHKKVTIDTGISRHPFIYAGEWDYRHDLQTIYIVKKGTVVWTYSIPIKDTAGVLQEFGDVHQLSNGNILFSTKVGASEVTPDKKIVWNYNGPSGTEVHTAQPIGLSPALTNKVGEAGFEVPNTLIFARSDSHADCWNH